MKLELGDLGSTIDFATLIVVIIGLTFAGLELNQLRKAQESQTFIEFYKTVRSQEYQNATALIRSIPDGLSAVELREQLSDEQMDLISHLFLTYEGMGIMVYRRDIALEWVDELFRLHIMLSWDKLEPLIQDNRKRLGYSGWGEWHQWLVERLRERSEGQPLPAYEAYSDWKP